MHPVEKKAEYDRHVARMLNGSVFLKERSDECIGEVGCGELVTGQSSSRLRGENIRLHRLKGYLDGVSSSILYSLTSNVPIKV